MFSKSLLFLGDF